MYTSVIICTKDRPDALFECLVTFIYQNNKPDEILIVDSSSEENKKKVQNNINKIRKIMLLNINIKLIHSEPGLTHQRNIGIKNINDKSELVFFLDDDSIVLPDYFQNILEAVQNNKEVSGFFGITIDKNTHKHSCLKQFIKRSFLITNNFGSKSKIMKSFNPSFRGKFNGREYFSEIMNGNMVCRRKVFNSVLFDENLRSYALMEDIDFSFRVSKLFKIMQVPNAFIFHNYSNANRLDICSINFMKGVNHRYLFKKNMKKSIINNIAFWWSVLGYILLFFTESYKNNPYRSVKCYIRGLKNYKMIYEKK